MSMRSVNFEFLRKANPELADLGGFAERYLFSDTNSALIKLRTFGESVVSAIYQQNSLHKPQYANFIDLLNEQDFIDCVPEVVISKLHVLRINGNKAAHGGFQKQPTSEHIIWLIKEAHSVGQWFSIAYLKLNKAELGDFVQLRVQADTQTRPNKIVEETLAAQEAQLKRLIEELEQARKEASALAKSNSELKLIKSESQKAADALSFNEEQTRKILIDEALRDAGWNVSANGDSTSEVGQEIAVEHQPTPSGMGAIDYVLYDDSGKPLAVIEAKKTSKNKAAGKKQAELYAEGLEKMTGEKPIIFYTNGYDIGIWNKSKNEPPREIFGFYSKESLISLRYQAQNRVPLNSVSHNIEVVDRAYQIEAIRRVTERFSGNYRKSLIVLATGTGKTRVAVAICDILSKATWAKRILFLCDRRELRKQADKDFGKYMPGEPRVFVNRKTAEDRTKRIYLATYPAMMKAYTNFDVGFFDLVIADESHRSVYNMYSGLFKYFDALQIGLTATPVKYIARNTFRLFGCEDQKPTADFTYEEAIAHKPPYLVPFVVTKHTTKFLRGGIKYSQMSEEQKDELEDQVEDPESVDYSREEVDKRVFNKDTDRKILQNLMESGIRNAEDALVGKSIIFARNHDHAIHLNELFDELYPQYAGKICAVIDNYEPRAEHLIDEFKDPTNPLMIAISVDMLDTGIDVPQVVNLVFAKPIKSYVKFRQMIGRGTRLCPDLFGPGNHKTHFQIFDHWGNFEYFSEEFEEEEPSHQKSMLQKLFETRIEAAERAVANQDIVAHDIFFDLIHQDINALPDDSVSVKEKWRQKQQMMRIDQLKVFDVTVRTILRNDLAPLMQWRNTIGNEKAYAFDLLITRAESALLGKSADYQDMKDNCQIIMTQLPTTINAVREKISLIELVKGDEFWKSATIESLENARKQLRGLMRYRLIPESPETENLRIDVTDDGIVVESHASNLKEENTIAYRQQVRSILDRLFERNPVLQKIKRCEPVSEIELKELVKKVEATDPKLNIGEKLIQFPDANGHLDTAIRHVIGLDADKVEDFFKEFFQANPGLSSHQIRFLGLLKSHIAQYGRIELDTLWEAPFTAIHEEGIDGVFYADEQVDRLITLIKKINSYTATAGRAV